ARTRRCTPRRSARGGGERPGPADGAVPARGAGVHHAALRRGGLGAAVRQLQPGQCPRPRGRRPGGGRAQPGRTGAALRVAVGAARAAPGARDAGGAVQGAAAPARLAVSPGGRGAVGRGADWGRVAAERAPTPALPRKRGRGWTRPGWTGREWTVRGWTGR